MNLQKEYLELQLGRYVHQDVEGNYLLSEDDLDNLLAKRADRKVTALVFGGVAALVVGIILRITDLPFV